MPAYGSAVSIYAVSAARVATFGRDWSLVGLLSRARLVLEG